MHKITAADTLEMSIQERIQLVEDIWDTITEHTENVQLSEDEKRIIEILN